MIGTREALSWIKEQQLHRHTGSELESDSLMVVQGINNSVKNLLDVRDILEQFKVLLNELVATSINFVRNQANR